MIELADIKNYLEITDCESDGRLKAILDDCESFILSFLGDITQGEKSERVPKDYIRSLGLLPFKIGNVTAIKEINGTDFSSKVEGTDYVINGDGTAEVVDLLDYVCSGDFSSILVKYDAGWENVPDDIIAASAEYVGGVYASEYGRDVAKEQLGPRSVEYFEAKDSNGKQISHKKKLSEVLTRYIPLHLRAW